MRSHGRDKITAPELSSAVDSGRKGGDEYARGVTSQSFQLKPGASANRQPASDALTGDTVNTRLL
jgi:hypothetical protein